MEKSGDLIQVKDADTDIDLAQRKAQLIRQGDFYRAGVLHAKASIKQAVRPENVMHNIIDHATFALRSRVDGLLRPTGINIGTVMPYAMSIISFINRRRLHKPALGVAALAAVAAWYMQRRHRAQLAHM